MRSRKNTLKSEIIEIPEPPFEYRADGHKKNSRESRAYILKEFSLKLNVSRF